ncbi:MAG: NADH-quinone oxidoreductase subunit NuoE [Tissierellales bacterium]|nr:NADH-quinone oxidoreductase subunit NuoE [Tissierellales bacterium]
METKTEMSIQNTKKILEKYPKDKRYTLAILQDIQRNYDYIPKEAIWEVSNYIESPLSEVYTIATFYKALSLKPKGKYVIKVCNGTACHIRGSDKVLDAIKSSLNIQPGETSEDGLFSIEIVNCVGACALAPVMVINDKYYGNMTKDKVHQVLDEIRRSQNE